MNKPRHAKLSTIAQRSVDLSDGTLVVMWVAQDTTGRKFAALTEHEALEMLAEYNRPRPART